jgi:tetratricopeptide (TPR) repeat protein
MSSSVRIDELRKKFDENPRRYFAPLANEYRKVGDLEQAIFICQEYLPQQPGHMSGHIVYGQALFESKRNEEARAVFETALGLDPENLIALRHMGDIAFAAGNEADARTWYTRVLDADPRNEEINGLLASMAPAPAAPPSVAAPAPEPAASLALAEPEEPVRTGTGSLLDPEPPAGEPTPAHASLLIEPTAEEAPVVESLLDDDVALLGPPPEPAPEPATAPDLDFGQQVTAVVAAVKVAPPAPPAPAPPPPADDASGSADDGLMDLGDIGFGSAPTPVVSQAAVARPASPVFSEPEPTTADEDFDLGSFGDAPEPKIPEAATPEPQAIEPEMLDIPEAFEVPGTPEVPQAALTEVVDVLEPEPALDTAAIAADAAPLDDLSIDDGAAAPVEPEAEVLPPAPSPSQPPFVTETMAKLYLDQGHRDEALAIYRQLVDRAPEDAQLRARVAELEAPPAPAGPTIREFLQAIFARRDHSVIDTGASAAPIETSDPTGDADTSASDAVPAEEPLAEGGPGGFEELFGGAKPSARDEAAATTLAAAYTHGGEALHGMPAHRASGELSLDTVFNADAPRRQSESAFSLHQYFAPGTVQDGAGRTPDAALGTRDVPSDDVEQFNSWLTGLKKT